jgi:hypothetical protein
MVGLPYIRNMKIEHFPLLDCKKDIYAKEVKQSNYRTGQALRVPG